MPTFSVHPDRCALRRSYSRVWPIDRPARNSALSPSLLPSLLLTQSKVEFLLSVLLVNRSSSLQVRNGRALWAHLASVLPLPPLGIRSTSLGLFAAAPHFQNLKRAASSPLLRLSLPTYTPQHTTPTPTEQKTTRNYGRSRQLEREGRPVRSHRRRQHGRRTSPPPRHRNTSPLCIVPMADL